MTSSEERKARMRAYYQKNKAKWKTYNATAKSKLSEEEYKEKQRVYYEKHYAENREAIIARTTEYQKKHRGKFTEYKARYFQENKQRIHAQRRKHYHEVVKPRSERSRQTSEYVTIRQAVEVLGAKLRPFRTWVYQGRIESVKTATGRYLLKRSDVEEIKAGIRDIPVSIRQTLGLTKEDSNEQN